jgi:hypothetical protein
MHIWLLDLIYYGPCNKVIVLLFPAFHLLWKTVISNTRTSATSFSFCKLQTTVSLVLVLVLVQGPKNQTLDKLETGISGFRFLKTESLYHVRHFQVSPQFFGESVTSVLIM